VHAAALLADEPGQAWLRLWARALVLAFLTGRPVPWVPGPLRSAGQLPVGGQALSPRGRECLLATVIDTAIAARAPALRSGTGWTGCGGTRWRWGPNTTAGSP